MNTPRRAATILVLRDRPSQPQSPAQTPAQTPIDPVEVLLVRRGHRASFMANAYVFPGGRVDDSDSQPTPDWTTQRCAARELSEEAGLRVHDLPDLVPFARWITPSAEPKRFDTDFFLWAMPADQTPVVDEKEVFDLRWLSPRAAMKAYAEDGLNLPPPTVCTLEDLQAEIDLALRDRVPGTSLLSQLLQSCRRRQPVVLLPRLRGSAGGGIEIVMPWDPEFAATPGEGDPQTCLALHGAPVDSRISRCAIDPPGVWRFARSAIINQQNK